MKNNFRLNQHCNFLFAKMLLAVANDAFRESIDECAFFVWWLSILESCEQDESPATTTYARHGGRKFALSKDKANERERTRSGGVVSDVSSKRNYEYDREMRWLESIATKNLRGVQLQNMHYDFDDVGNIKQYTNDCLTSTNAQEVSGRYKTSQKYTYDGLCQLTSVTGTAVNDDYASSGLGSAAYNGSYTQTFAFDAIGNMTHKVSKESVTSGRRIGDDLTYSFDYVYDENFAHRLKRAGNEQNGYRHFSYDANGNVIEEKDTVSANPNEETNGLFPATMSVTSNAAGETVYQSDYAWGYFKDANPGSTSYSGSYKRSYSWDSRNLLIASSDNTNQVYYTYDANGERTNKYTHRSEILYFNQFYSMRFDGGVGYGSGQSVKHIFLGDTRIVTKLNSVKNASYQEEVYKQYFYHSDHLGSASLISDFEGREYQRIEYTPYGETWVEKSSNTGMEYLPYKFTGKERDEETGLYYYGARYLDLQYSRWLSMDPALGEYIPLASLDDKARRHNENLPGMGRVYNYINLNLYHYSANNPVKYVDPDGKFPLAVIPIIIGIGLLLKSDTAPRREPVDANAINTKLANTFYDDPALIKGPSISAPYTRENSKSLTLESHPVLALACALPTGNYSESDYSNPNQMTSPLINDTRTVLDGLGLFGTVMKNLSDGHVGDVTLTYKKTNGKITSWFMTLTTLDPKTGRSTARQVFSKEDALIYLNNNKEVLKNDPAYKQLKDILD